MKNILVTGVSKGLGLKIVEVLLEEGNCVYGISRTQSEALIELKAKHSSYLHLLQYDLSNVNEIREIVFKKFIGKTPLHGFVNNAAIAYDDIVTNADMQRLEHMYRVNVFSPMNITKYFIRNLLLHKNKGSIVHISSISVHTGYKGLSMYAGSKGALEAYSRNTSREWASLGVKSNCIVSGFMDTEMSSSLSSDQKNRIYKRTSQKQAVDPYSIANTVSFLLSDKSQSITGQNIHVDSGTI